MQEIFIEKFSHFIAQETEPLPNVSFVPMLTRRRLSPLSKLVAFVSRGISDSNPEQNVFYKTTLASQFGEITQQLKISQSQIDTGNISPAHFSQSVFNASIANATILEKNIAGYSATFNGKDSFLGGLKDCIAALETEEDDCRNFIFAEERIPETYAPIAQVKYPNVSCALALRLTKNASNSSIALDSILKDLQPHHSYESAAEEALDFIKILLARQAESTKP